MWGQEVPHDRLWLLDLDTGQSHGVDGLGDRHVVELAQRPDGGPLAVLSQATPELDPGRRTCALQVVDPETGKVRSSGGPGWRRPRPPGGTRTVAGTCAIWRPPRPARWEVARSSTLWCRRPVPRPNTSR
ncbi:hypothetical protein ACFQYP_20365 [Nonomuraea antimicrobica]